MSRSIRLQLGPDELQNCSPEHRLPVDKAFDLGSSRQRSHVRLSHASAVGRLYVIIKTFALLGPLLKRKHSTADGTCIIEALIGPGSTSARASLLDVTKGAVAVIRRCVEQRNPGEGGLAKELGE